MTASPNEGERGLFGSSSKPHQSHQTAGYAQAQGINAAHKPTDPKKKNESEGLSVSVFFYFAIDLIANIALICFIFTMIRLLPRL
jgi:hypothetical protein